MSEGLLLLVTIGVGIAGSVLLIARYRWHPFIALLLAAYFVGMSSGLGVEATIETITGGFGDILGNIGIVIIAGTIIGTILEKTGAALTMANTILRFVGKRRVSLTMSLTGYVTSIPVFCDSGFVILSPINRALAEKSNTSLAVMATALSAGLYATHSLVPPTPGPIIMADQLGADLGLLILVGASVAVPVMVAGYLYAKHVSSSIHIDANPEATVEELQAKYGKLPSAGRSFAPIVVPIILIALSSIASFPTNPFGTGGLQATLNFFGNPVTALLIGIALSMRLMPKQEKGTGFEWIGKGIVNAAAILAITGAGGALGAILQELPIDDVLSATLLQYEIGILLPFLIGVLLKTAMGASTVAMIITSAMVAPLMVELGLDTSLGRILTVLAIGSGAMMVSHVNDSYFWVVAKFSDMTTTQAYKAQTGMTFVQGVVSITILSGIAALFL